MKEKRILAMFITSVVTLVASLAVTFGIMTTLADPTMFWAYRNSKDAGCDDLNFYETIWERDIEYIVETCRANEIKQITISSSFSGMPEVLWEFCKLGCKVVGMKQVPSNYEEWDWEEQKKLRRLVPAVILKIN